MKLIKHALITLFFIQSVSNAFSSSYDIIIQKDLFDEKRGQSTKDQNQQVSAASKELFNKHYLAGIIKINNKKHVLIKIFPEDRQNPYYILKEGDKLEGWTIVEITDKSVTFKWQNETVMINMWQPEKGPRQGLQRLTFSSQPPQVYVPPPPPPPPPPQVHVQPTPVIPPQPVPNPELPPQQQMQPQIHNPNIMPR